MGTLRVIGPDGTEHEYLGNERAAVTLARELAEAHPGQPVRIVGVAGGDDLAINHQLVYTEADGVVTKDLIGVLR